MDTKSVNQLVWKILQEDLAVQKDLQRKIINVRSLARYLITTRRLTVSLDSVISAIRRFQGAETFDEERKILNIFRDSLVTTKNNVACITLTTPQRELFKKITNLGVPVKISTGRSETKVILEKRSLEYFLKQLVENDIVNIEDDLSEINVVINRKGLETKGILARIASEIALANINIQEIIICPPEFLIYVKEKNTLKTHEAVLKLCREY